MRQPAAWREGMPVMLADPARVITERKGQQYLTLIVIGGE
jgi:hypothetical protein